MTTETDPYEAARKAQGRVNVLAEIQSEARTARDTAVVALLRDGHRVNTIARKIGCVEGTVRQIKAKTEGGTL